MKIREGFVVREIQDAIIAVPTGDLVKEFHSVINLNKKAEFLWNLLENEITFDDLVVKLIENYNVDIEKAKSDAEKFVNQLKNYKIIEE